MALDLSKGNQAGIFWEDGDVEVGLYWAIRELVPLEGIFVDCGANCGLMGLLARQYRRARVIFLEPHPRLAKSIAANIRLNNFTDSCELIEAAVSDTSGTVTFYENSVADGSHSVHQDWATDLGEMRSLGQVRCITLQEIIEAKKPPKIHFLKIDAEGNDFAVLKGLGRYLHPAFTEVLYVEMSREIRAITDLLQARGYIGFTAAVETRHDRTRLQQHYEQGGQAGFFQPLNPGALERGDALWCGQDSSAARYLNDLRRSPED
jgi:FkbM family methyltransferase